MELDHYCFILAFVVFVLMLIKTSIDHKNSRGNPRLPPGPWKLPLIGSLHHLVGRSLPHHTLRNLARIHGPLMHLQLGETLAIVVSSCEVAKEILKTQDLNFSNRHQIQTVKIIFYGCNDLVFSPYGPHWRQARRISMEELLSVKQVKSFEPIRKDEVEGLVRNISESHGSLVNLSLLFLSFTNDVIARAAFGSKFNDRKLLLAKIKKILETINGFTLGDLFPSSTLIRVLSGTIKKTEKLHQEMDLMLDEIIRQHKEMMPYEEGHLEDFVDVLLRLQRDSCLECPLTDQIIKGLILDMFVAATDSTSIALEWIMAELMKNPDAMAKAQEEVRSVWDGKPKFIEKDLEKMSYLKMVIKESLRLHPPAPLLVPRESGDDCEVLGYVIPSKSKIIVNFWAIGRDPKIWTDPESFKPERFVNSNVDFKGTNFELIPFGAGRRMCSGISFAVASIELALAKLLYHFDWKLPIGVEPASLDMHEGSGITRSRRSNLLVHATPFITQCCGITK